MTATTQIFVSQSRFGFSYSVICPKCGRIGKKYRASEAEQILVDHEIQHIADFNNL